ncbi:MAG: hypothetical protein HY320_05295 [Armatimonadetes bacterium]|nr:hypothetical protein [Armatimonadota bacterium]
MGQEPVRAAWLPLIGGAEARTYAEAAVVMGPYGLHTHLRRRRFPEAYAAVMEVRWAQLAERHREAEALARVEAHSREWFLRQRNRRFYYRFGYWPWQRRGRGRSAEAGLCALLRRLG